MNSDALTDWAIRPWVELGLRANFVQLLQFHPFLQCSCFMSVFTFVSCHICSKRSLAQVVTLVVEWIDTYGIHHLSIFLKVTIESWLEWDLNPQPLNSVQMLWLRYQPMSSTCSQKQLCLTTPISSISLGKLMSTASPKFVKILL